jgi:hypothetical protein
MSGVAEIEVPGASRNLVTALTLSEEDRGLVVREEVAGAVLPAFCPERHVNDDGSFCLGYGAERLVTDRDSAIVWWGLLLEFLKLQRVAGRTRLWPPRQALSHGSAGPHHVTALAAAKALGLVENYHRMLEGEEHWFSSDRVRTSKDGKRLVNGRAECPNSCVDRRGRPILRRSCCNKDAVISLVASEKARRKAEEEYWRPYRASGTPCCGSMRACPLRDGHERRVENRTSTSSGKQPERPASRNGKAP